MDRSERMAQLEKLRADAAISDEEYLQQKAMIEDEQLAAEKVAALAEEAASKAALPPEEVVEPPVAPAPTSAAAAAAPSKTPMELAEARNKKSNIAMFIEVVGGLFLLLGLGHMYAGYVGAGLLRLLLWLVTVALVSGFFLSGVSGFLALCLIPMWMGMYVAVPLWSGFKLKKRVRNDG